MGWYPYLEQADDAGLVDVLAVGLGAGGARGRGGGGRGEQEDGCSGGAATGGCDGWGRGRRRRVPVGRRWEEEAKQRPERHCWACANHEQSRWPR